MANAKSYVDYINYMEYMENMEYMEYTKYQSLSCLPIARVSCFLLRVSCFLFGSPPSHSSANSPQSETLAPVAALATRIES